MWRLGQAGGAQRSSRTQPDAAGRRVLSGQGSDQWYAWQIDFEFSRNLTFVSVLQRYADEHYFLLKNRHYDITWLSHTSSLAKRCCYALIYRTIVSIVKIVNFVTRIQRSFMVYYDYFVIALVHRF